MEKIIIFLVCTSLFILPFTSLKGQPLLEKANSILKKLYHVKHVKGDKSKDIPTIQIDSVEGGAEYKAFQNIIILDAGIYKVCQNLADDADDALAFIIGHELAHSFQNITKDSNYFSSKSDRDLSRRDIERQADINGAFLAYLAGYKIVEVIPDLMQRLYQDCLIIKGNPNYPTPEERRTTAIEVQKKVTELIQNYEIAAYLTAIGKYEIAAAVYDYIAKTYKSKEIHNNIGVNKLLHAMNFTAFSSDLYWLPIEIDWEIRLKKKAIRGGVDNLTNEEKNLRGQYLKEALNHFKVAKSFDAAYLEADLNILCIYALRGQARQAEQHFKKIKVENNLIEKNKLELALAIAYINSKSPNYIRKGEKLLTQLQYNDNQMIKNQAIYNLNVLSNPDFKEYFKKKNNCFGLDFGSNRIDNINIHNYWKPDSVLQVLNKPFTIFFEKLNNSEIYHFQNTGDCFFNIQRIKKLNKKPPLPPNFRNKKALNTSNGHFLVCNDQQLIFRISNGEILDWAKYYSY